jgi:hypothetical protein
VRTGRKKDDLTSLIFFRSALSSAAYMSRISGSARTRVPTRSLDLIGLIPRTLGERKSSVRPAYQLKSLVS